MPVVLLRHGESTANAKKIVAGRSMTPEPRLNNRGMCQTQETPGRLLELYPRIRTIQVIGSRLLRVRQTSDIFVETTRVEYPHIVIDHLPNDPRIEERDLGSYTGRRRTFFRDHPDWFNDSECIGAESPEDFVGRVADFLGDIATHEACERPDLALLVVSHAGIGRAIEVIRQGARPDCLYHTHIAKPSNAACVPIDIQAVRTSLAQGFPGICPE